jgi:prepilin-type N-terminal cleavage/methylation domain-containing protein
LKTGIWIDKKKGLKNSGFTLIEIVIVVLIIGLLALVLLPRMAGFSGGNSKTAIRHLTGTIQTLRDEAEFQQKIFRLNFNISEQKYDVSLLNENGEFVPYHSDSIGVAEFRGKLLLKDVVTLRQGKVSEGTAYLFFYPLGRVEKGYLHFEDEGRPFTLQIYSISGKVKWYDGYLEQK